MASIEEYHVNQASRMAYVSGQSQGATVLAMENFYGGFMATTGGPMGLLNRERRMQWNQGEPRTFATGAGDNQFCNIITGIGFIVNSYETLDGVIVRPTDVLNFSGSTTSTPDYKLNITEANAGTTTPKLFPPMNNNELHIPLVSGRYIHVPVYYTGMDNSGTSYQPSSGDGFPASIGDVGMNREGLPGSFPGTDEFYFVRDGSSCASITDSKRFAAQRHPINPASNADNADLVTSGGSDREEFKNRRVIKSDSIQLSLRVADYDTGNTSPPVRRVHFTCFDIYGMVFRFNRT